MTKPKIGAALCLMTSLAAAVIYFWIDINFAESMVLLKNLSFCRFYYSALFFLDAVMLLYLFVRAYVLQGRKKEKNGQTRIANSVLSHWPEAVLMEVYAAINVFFAIRLFRIIDMDMYVPLMFAKGVFFAVFYQIQAASSFIRRKTWMRILAIAGIAILALAVYMALRWYLESEPFNDVTLYLNLLINAYLSNVGKTWPTSNYWMAAAAIVGVECLLPTLRLIALALYNTKCKLTGR